jgi:hypothetical protein
VSVRALRAAEIVGDGQTWAVPEHHVHESNRAVLETAPIACTQMQRLRLHPSKHLGLCAPACLGWCTLGMSAGSGQQCGHKHDAERGAPVNQQRTTAEPECTTKSSSLRRSCPSKASGLSYCRGLKTVCLGRAQALTIGLEWGSGPCDSQGSDNIKKNEFKRHFTMPGTGRSMKQNSVVLHLSMACIMALYKHRIVRYFPFPSH